MRTVLVIALLAGGCAGASSRPRVIGAVVAASAATVGAYAIQQDRPSSIGLELGAGVAASVLPAIMLDAAAAPDNSASNDGRMFYASFGNGSGDGFGEVFIGTLLVAAPAFATYSVGNWREDESGGQWSFLGGYIGAGTMMLAGTFLVERDLPRWARIALLSMLGGAGATLGYQIGRGADD